MFLRLSIALQRGNAVALLVTFDAVCLNVRAPDWAQDVRWSAALSFVSR